MTPSQLDKIFRLLTGTFVALIVVIALLCGLYSALPYLVRAYQTQRLQAVAADVRPLVERCQGKPSSPVVEVRGKVLVWDMRSDSMSDAQEHLVDDLRATSPEGEITVFMIVGEHPVPEPSPLGLGCSGCYRQHIDVCVAYWPRKEPVAAFSVPGKPLEFG